MNFGAVLRPAPLAQQHIFRRMNRRNTLERDTRARAAFPRGPINFGVACTCNSAFEHACNCIFTLVNARVDVSTRCGSAVELVENL